MRRVIEIDGIKFWKEDSIIHCKIDSTFFQNYNRAETEQLFYDAITHLYDNEYMPFLIDMELMSNYDALKLFKLISNSSRINALVLTKTFYVPTFGLKVMLELHTFIGNRIVPNKIIANYNKAINYCHKDYQLFNQIS